MWWLETGTCEAAHRFGWFVGNLTGLLAAVTITLLIVSAPAYRPDVPRWVRRKVRVGFQWVFLVVPYVLAAAACVIGGFRVGWLDLACYVTTLALGTATVLAPLMLLLMFTTAHVVGRAAAR